jgi:hypothetical protein
MLGGIKFYPPDSVSPMRQRQGEGKRNALFSKSTQLR